MKTTFDSLFFHWRIITVWVVSPKKQKKICTRSLPHWHNYKDKSAQWRRKIQTLPWVKECNSQKQSYAIVEVGRNLWSSSSPTPCSKQGDLEQVTRDCAQSGFECLQGRRLQNLSGQPVPVLDDSHNKKCFFLCLSENSYIWFTPFASSSFPSYHQELDPSSLLVLTHTLIYVYKASAVLKIPALSAFPWMTDAPVP